MSSKDPAGSARSRRRQRRQNRSRLGPLLHVERPTRRGVGWLPGLVGGCAFGLPWFYSSSYPAWHSLSGLLIALASFVVGFAVLSALFSEVLLLEHRLYEGGLTSGSRIPLSATYVLPLASIDARTLTAGPPLEPARDVPRELRRCRRHASTAQTVQFSGLAPTAAVTLGSGSRSWTSIRADSDRARWSLSYRDAPAGVARLRSALERSPSER